MASSTTSDAAAARLADVLELLCEHLTAGALFRLRVALGRRGEEAPGVARLVAARMGLVAAPARGPPRSMAWLAARLRAARRCRECGAPTARAVRVCAACADGDTLHALRDRAHARWLNRQRAAPRRNFEAYLRRCVRPAARTATGRLLYWRRDLLRLVGDAARERGCDARERGRDARRDASPSGS